MIAFCKDKNRRSLVLQTTGLNGIDFVEVLGAPGCGDRLAVTFLKDARALHLAPENIGLTGETRLSVIRVLAATPDDPLTLTVVLSSTGTFSPYTLALVTGPMDNDPPPGIDPQLAEVTFSFKAGCPSPTDCQTDSCCPSPSRPAPDIHYLARDFDGFRQAMLDRMSTLLPDWSETHIADPGITLVEVLAYAADRLSYLQDAINTEAYLGTARSRISLRRHARLVDYRVGEGANARVWISLTAGEDVHVPLGTAFYPLVSGLGASVDPDSYAAALLTASPGPVFESLEPIDLHPEQNRMNFYTWGDGACCLPAGATEATLSGAYPTLKAGQVLIFEEVLGPLSGDPADADPTHRWAVRLTSAATTNNLGHALMDPVNPTALLTRIAWHTDDALPFPLCLSSITAEAHGSLPQANVSVARGNIVAADHGVWTTTESLGVVPEPPPAPAVASDCCSSAAGALIPRPRYTPTLANQPLTFAVDYKKAASASSFLSPDVSLAKPQISLLSGDGGGWSPVKDLLELDTAAELHAFIPEIEWDGSAHLRFGDGTYGAAPDTGLGFTGTYRTGNGTAGNIGGEALAHVLFKGRGITGVRNPLGAAGGVDPETMNHILQVAPFTFQTQMRCVTAEDYGAQASALQGIREARGTVRWTGSWYSAFVSADPSALWTNDLQTRVKTSLNLLRMMGTDLVVEQAVFVGLRIGLQVCVDSRYFQGDVYAALWETLVTGNPCAETLGLLDPANFRFGETVYASPVIAAAQAVVGVAAVQLVTFERMDSPLPPGTAPPTQLTTGAVEIPRCDNDPDHADRGLLTLTLDGGK